MSGKTLKKAFEPGRGYSKEDWDEVDSPELTDEQIAKGRPLQPDSMGPSRLALLAPQDDGGWVIGSAGSVTGKLCSHLRMREVGCAILGDSKIGIKSLTP